MNAAGAAPFAVTGRGTIPALARAFLVYAGPARAIGAAAGMLFAGALEGVGIALFVPMLGLLTGRGQGRLQTIADRVFTGMHAVTTLQRLAAMLSGFVALLVLRAVAILLRDRRVQALQIGFIHHLRMKLMNALGAAPWSAVAQLRHARVLNALTTDIQRVASASILAVQASVAVVMLVAQFAVALLLAPKVALFSLIVMAAGALTLRPMVRRAKTLGEQMSHGNLAIVDSAVQLMGGLKVAAAQNLQRHFVASYEGSAMTMMDRQLAYQRRDGALRALMAVGSASAGALILFVGYWLEGPTTLLAVALLAIARMASPAMLTLQNVQLLAVLAPAYGTITVLTDELTTSPPGTSAVDASLNGTIELQRVSCAHDGHQAVSDLSIVIPAGTIVGIVGPSGAGKTTTIDLMAGLIAPDAGRILVGDTLLDASNLPRWRDRIAYVGQDSWLINASIRDNLTWGNADPGDDTLWSALRLAEAEALVRAMPEGLATEAAERGARLSGGERQRIALARALLRCPALLILDEATNAIDIAAERRILAQLVTLTPRPTIVMVAHRPETLEICERILTLRDGRLVDDEDQP